MAAAAGHLHVLTWAQNKNMELPARDRLAMCSRSGNLEVLRWAKENNFSLSEAFYHASIPGHALDWLAGEGEEDLSRDQADMCFQQAAKNGHVPIFRWFAEHGFFPIRTKEIYFGAAFFGHLEVLQWMAEKGYQEGRDRVSNHGARGGHLDVVKWEERERAQGEFQEEGERRIMEQAVEGESMETIQWVHENGGKLFPHLYYVALTQTPKKFYKFLNSWKKTGVLSNLTRAFGRRPSASRTPWSWSDDRGTWPPSAYPWIMGDCGK
jgi:hypothetical protein